MAGCFAPVKRLAGKIVSKMSCNALSNMLAICLCERQLDKWASMRLYLKLAEDSGNDSWLASSSCFLQCSSLCLMVWLLTASDSVVFERNGEETA